MQAGKGWAEQYACPVFEMRTQQRVRELASSNSFALRADGSRTRYPSTARHRELLNPRLSRSGLPCRLRSGRCCSRQFCWRRGLFRRQRRWRRAPCGGSLERSGTLRACCPTLALQVGGVTVWLLLLARQRGMVQPQPAHLPM